jgi:hypothetical protein
MTNADQGVVLTYVSADGGNNGMAVTTGTSVSVVSLDPVVSDPFGPVVPVLQLQDGSFAGSVWGDGPLMVAFDQTGSVRWSAPNVFPKIATADGGVIAQTYDPTTRDFTGAVVAFDQNGNATGQLASLPTQSWLGNVYQVGCTKELLAIPFMVLASFAPFAALNASGNATSVKEDWFPSLDHCTSAPGCIGHHEAIYNALKDLVARLSDPALAGLAQSKVFDKLGNDSQGKKLTTASFISYLTIKEPGFYDATRSGYCWDALSPVDDKAFCNSWVGSFFTQSIAGHFKLDPSL